MRLSQRIREAPTVEQALTLLLEASSSEAKFRSRVRAASSLEDALDEILDHKGVSFIADDVKCPANANDEAPSCTGNGNGSGEQTNGDTAGVRNNAFHENVNRCTPFHTLEPAGKRTKHSNPIRIAPSTKRPRLPDGSNIEAPLKHVRVNQPINDASSTSHHLGCLGEQGQGGRVGDRTRRPHPVCSLRIPKPHNGA